MSRGKTKPNIRYLNRADLSFEEGRALFEALKDSKHPMAVAIIGAEMVEHELDLLLYRAMKSPERKVWDTLITDIGPLSTFHRKIVLGHALRLYDEKERHDLTVVKSVRNVFAHNRKLITFEHPLVIDELSSCKLMPKKNKRAFLQNKEQRAETVPGFYMLLCMRLSLKLMKKKKPSYRLRGRSRRLGLLASLLASGPSVPASHSADPSPQGPPGILFGLAQAPPSKEPK